VISRINVSDTFFVSVISHHQPLMTETDISETLVFNSTLVWLIASEDFSAFIRRERFKLY
jgi:hypothetical protein